MINYWTTREIQTYHLDEGFLIDVVRIDEKIKELWVYHEDVKTCKEFGCRLVDCDEAETRWLILQMAPELTDHFAKMWM